MFYLKTIFMSRQMSIVDSKFSQLNRDDLQKILEQAKAHAPTILGQNIDDKDEYELIEALIKDLLGHQHINEQKNNNVVYKIIESIVKVLAQ